jgi:hypothetical protein
MAEIASAFGVFSFAVYTIINGDCHDMKTILKESYH